MKKGDIILKRDSELLGVVRRSTSIGPVPAVLVVWLKMRQDVITGERMVQYNHRTGKPVFWDDALYERYVEVLEEV